MKLSLVTLLCVLVMAAANVNAQVANAVCTTDRNAVAHELGHSFGLLDCYNCVEGSTVMNDLKGMNVGNGMDGPTDCDVAAVKKAYLTVRAQAASLDSKIIELVIDEGEEPVETSNGVQAREGGRLKPKPVRS